MRIESMDASNSIKLQDSEVRIAKQADQTEPVQPAQTAKNPLLMTGAEKKELSISDKAVIDAIERANRAISISNRKFEYSIHAKTKEIMIKVIDADTNEIIREIPPEKILDMVAKMWEMAGLIVDERR